jgi:hypothetical protein
MNSINREILITIEQHKQKLDFEYKQIESVLNEFSKKLAESICVHLATRGEADLEGKDWEKIFAECIGAKWSHSNS